LILYYEKLYGIFTNTHYWLYYVFQATMKPSLDSDEEEEFGTLQKTLRGDV